MSFGRSTVWAEGEVLTATALNAEFDAIVTAGNEFNWPATENRSMDGFALLLDDNGDTLMKASVDDRIDFVSQGGFVFQIDATVTSVNNGLVLIGSANGTEVVLKTIAGSDSNVHLDLQTIGTGILAHDGGSLMSHTQQILCAQTFGY